MANMSSAELYGKLKDLMVNEFGYGDELQSGDAGFESLLDTGTIADRKGKRIRGEDGRNEAGRIKELGNRLRSGQSLFIYKKGDLYPTEVFYNKKSGQLEVSPQTTDEMDPKAPEEPSAWDKFKDFCQLLVNIVTLGRTNFRNEKCLEWDRYNDRKEAIKNANDEKRIERRRRNDPKLNQAEDVVNKSVRDTYRSFVSILKNRMGYAAELNQKGNNKGMEDLLREGNVVDAEGKPLSAKSSKQDDLVNLIGTHLLVDKKPLYVYKPGTDYPYELRMDENGKLKLSDKPINEMDNSAKSKNPVEQKLIDARKALLEILSRPEILEQHRALSRVKLEKYGKQVDTEPKQSEKQQNNLAEKNSEMIIQNGPDKEETMRFLNMDGRYKSETPIVANEDWREGSEAIHKFVEKQYDTAPDAARNTGKKLMDSGLPSEFECAVGKAKKKLGDQDGKQTEKLLEEFFASDLTMEEGTEIFSADDPKAALEQKLSLAAKKKEEKTAPEQKNGPIAGNKAAQLKAEPEKPLSVEEKLANHLKEIDELKSRLSVLEQEAAGMLGTMKQKVDPAIAKGIENDAAIAKTLQEDENKEFLKEQQIKGDEELAKKLHTELNGTKPPENTANDEAIAKAMQEEENKLAAEQKTEQPTGKTNEVDALLGKLKEANGNKELSDTVKGNMHRLYDDAQKGKEALQEAIDDPKLEKFAGGNTVNAIAAFQNIKNSINDGYVNDAMIKAMDNENFASMWQETTKVSPDVVYASDYLHSKEFYKNNVLAEKGANALSDSVNRGVNKVFDNEQKYGREAKDVFWGPKVEAEKMYEQGQKNAQPKNKGKEIKIGDPSKAKNGMNYAKKVNHHPLEPNPQHIAKVQQQGMGMGGMK